MKKNSNNRVSHTSQLYKFAGVGNIIKNEILYRVRVLPENMSIRSNKP
jgi:formamidopyrimidine-DNA glycosylase